MPKRTTIMLEKDTVNMLKMVRSNVYAVEGRYLKSMDSVVKYLLEVWMNERMPREANRQEG